jgi:hypothetical protein
MSNRLYSQAQDPQAAGCWPAVIGLVLLVLLLLFAMLTSCESPSQAAAAMQASGGQDAFAQRISALRGKLQ